MRVMTIMDNKGEIVAIINNARTIPTKTDKVIINKQEYYVWKIDYAYQPTMKSADGTPIADEDNVEILLSVYK